MKINYKLIFLPDSSDFNMALITKNTIIYKRTHRIKYQDCPK